MSDSRDKLREGLLSLELINPDLQAKYREEIEKMFTEKITGVTKFGWCSRDLFLLLFGIVLILSALINFPIALPTVARWLWGLCGVFTLAMSMLGLRYASRKTLDLRKDSRLIASFASIGLIIIAFAILLAAFLSRDLEIVGALTPIALLIMISAILIGVDSRVQQAELNTREKLLEIELRLASLDERLQKGGGTKT